MTTDKHDPENAQTLNVSRRDFIARSVAAGLVAATGPSFAAPLAVVETEVTVKTPDGTCDAAFVHPASGAYPGVIIWADALGLRPTMRDMAKRLAADGYSVLVPNLFYRVSKAPQFTTAANLDFKSPDLMTKIGPLMSSVQAAGAVEKDAVAYVAFLDAQPQVDRTKKIGTQGYCMGGALVVRTAASVPERIGAGASFHGGGLVTDKPDSPHLLAPKIKARMYFGVAASDDQRQPAAKDKLKESFAKAGVPVEVEVYPAKHGWCIPDMPIEDGAPIYDKAQAERAWSKLVALYKTLG
ncbi:MAG TPA: dienelactone hydrolase family protein [Casimicrobiaceae bacterium]|nr:dienelactone hydrolase family protein [Casimicrobiaceae bacterium]